MSPALLPPFSFCLFFFPFFSVVFLIIYHKKLPKITVQRNKIQSAVPDVGSTVIGKVIRVNPNFATLAILLVGVHPCQQSYQGIIRLQDVRATEKDKVQIKKSFRPGDIVRLAKEQTPLLLIFHIFFVS